VRLLLDEMISRRAAAGLREPGHDVVSVTRDPLHLRQLLDRTVLEAAAEDRRAVVTNNVRDFRARHERLRARGEDHYGIVFTYDDTLPRTREAAPLWVSRLRAFLDAHPAGDALLNRTYVLP
jgi:predicted nuclease of predicted toxin-antitoxin system